MVDGAHDLRSEYVVRVTGAVRRRPEGTANPGLPTGEIELGPCEVEILSVAEPPPFQIDERVEVDETIRLRYRYVDLRAERMQRNLRVRATVNSALRRAMEAQGFTEVETPMLIASTPEGARDFVVPSRLSPGSFYALPQSPQLFKQLCMVGGVDRYYQIARCLRDEDLRADRQFEFMQLDAEASFVTQAEVLAFISEAVAEAAEAVTGERPATVPAMTWREAQERFGSDKPDVRFGMELTELTEVFAGTGFNAFKAPCVKGILVPGAGDLGRNKLDALTDQAKRWGAKGLVWMRVEPDETGTGLALNSPVAKFLTRGGAGRHRGGRRRRGRRPGADRGRRAPVGEPRARPAAPGAGPPAGQPGRLQLPVGGRLPAVRVDRRRRSPGVGPPSLHHAPRRGLGPAGQHRPARTCSRIRSQAYDLVLNGWELGSGSVRIHRSDIQSRIFGLLGISPEEAQAKFGFLLDAFRYGAPPHAGFAFGIDRLAALLAGEENIREVIAFPKTQSGTDPLTSAPSPFDPTQLTELGLAGAAQGDLTRSISRRRPDPPGQVDSSTPTAPGAAAGNIGCRPRLALDADGNSTTRNSVAPRRATSSVGVAVDRAKPRRSSSSARARPTSGAGASVVRNDTRNGLGSDEEPSITGDRPQGMAMPCTASATVGRPEAGEAGSCPGSGGAVGPAAKKPPRESLGAGEAGSIGDGRAGDPVVGPASAGRDPASPTVDGPAGMAGDGTGDDGSCRPNGAAPAPGAGGVARSSPGPGPRIGMPLIRRQMKIPNGTSTTAQISRRATSGRVDRTMAAMLAPRDAAVANRGPGRQAGDR